MPKKKLINPASPGGTAAGRPFVKGNAKKTKVSFFERLNRWFDENYSGFMVFLCVLSFVFSLLLFNVRISEGGDDATYIEAGYNYSIDFFNYHFTYNAPLYPMFLSIPIKIFGINLRILKFTSVLFSLLHLIFLFLAFKKRIPNAILYAVLFIVAVNSFFLFHASQTYNEAFFLFIQAWFLYTAFTLIEKAEDPGRQFSDNYRYWIFFGFAAFILTLSKNIAVLGIGAVTFYFLVYRKFKNAFLTVAFFLLFRIPYEIFSYFVWVRHSQYSSQLSTQLLKDAYHPEKGNEDLAGFIDRFLGNADLYFSRRLMQILNFKNENNNVLYHSETIAVTLILLVSFWAVFKSKNKYLFITYLYTLGMIAFSFLALQISWDQPRLIMIFVPFMLMIAFFGLYYWLDYFGKSFLQFLFGGVLVVFMFLSFAPSIKKAKENLPILKKNIHGDMYYGYTPDWSNFLRMSEWCVKNLPDTAFVMSRKPSMSFIYSGGKKFYPVFMINTANADSVLTELKENNVTHAIVASLRKDRSKPADSANVINTVHRYLKPVVDKYPQALQFVHKIGEKESAYLLRIDYPDSILKKRSDPIKN